MATIAAAATSAIQSAEKRPISCIHGTGYAGEPVLSSDLNSGGSPVAWGGRAPPVGDDSGWNGPGQNASDPDVAASGGVTPPAANAAPTKDYREIDRKYFLTSDVAVVYSEPKQRPPQFRIFSPPPESRLW